MRRFLGRFLTTWRGYSLHASTIAPVSDPTTTLSRYILQSRHFKKTEGRATPGAFMPPPDRRLSTFAIDGLDEGAIWEIGCRVLVESPQPRLYGRAEITVGMIDSVGLSAERDDHPPRHVSVVGWASLPDPDAEKATHKMIAAQLAALSSFRPLPDST